MANNFSEKNPADYELIDRSSQMPAEADFALTLTDDCMEPYFKKGGTVYVQAVASLSEFEPGVFYHEGRIICRQWCEDYSGKVNLLCANPKREKENIRTDRDSLRCLGRVICGRKLPAPFYR